MKTLPLRDLVRQPNLVKKLTAKGQSVKVTDRGKPLWVVSPDLTSAQDESDEKARQEWLDGYLDELLAETPRKGMSAARMVIEDRGRH